jgi:hypothetical protein
MLPGQDAIRRIAHAKELAGGASLHRDVGLDRAFRDVQVRAPDVSMTPGNVR